MGRVANKWVVFLLMVLCAHSTTVLAQADTAFPSVPADRKTLRVLDKAEELFEAGNYKRAYFIYRNELAPIGDKYAQYMVGYMHLTGKGTDEDRVTATAWYRLAAERGTREFVTVRNQMLVSLTPEQMQECDRRFIELRKEYGDLPLLVRSVRADLEKLRARTGSRLGSDASPVTVIDMSQGGGTSTGAEYYRRIEERVRSRLEYIARHARIEIVDLDVNSIDLASVEEQVSQRLETID